MNPEAGPLIDTEQGEMLLCQTCCQMADQCQRTGPRVPPVNSMVMGYASEHNQGFKHYPWPGDWRGQPVWFMHLLRAARKYQVEAEAERAKVDARRAKAASNGN